MASEIFVDGVLAGLLWYPTVLAAGCKYSHEKQIDVSIDGLAVLAGIGAAKAWSSTGSLGLSLVSSVALGIASALLLTTIIHRLRVAPLIAGIVLTLGFHAASVLWIGESFPLRASPLVATPGGYWRWLVMASIGAAAVAVYFYRTNLGLLVRALVQNPALNAPISPYLASCGSAVVTGGLLGFGAGLYAHSEGVARAGGGFDFLLTGLTSFLALDRIVTITHRALDRQTTKPNTSTRYRHLTRLLVSVPAIALVGSIIFQILILAVLRWSPQPEAWKLTLGLLLLLAIATPDLRHLWPKRKWGAGQVPTSPPGVLRVRGLSKTVSDDGGLVARTLFGAIDLSADRGMVVLSGDNGTGKTTFLKILSGAIDADAGTVSVNGKSIDRASPNSRGVFFIHQQPRDNVAVGLRVYELLECLCEARQHPLRPATPKRFINIVTEKLGTWSGLSDVALWAERPSGVLSGGECQIFAVAMAIISGSPVILADEPTANLDQANRRRVASVISATARHRAVIVATHDEALKAMGDQALLFGESRSTNDFMQEATGEW